MISNLSVPADTILPHIVYRDVAAASAWLSRAFGFVEHYRYGGEVPAGAQMHRGNAWIMLRQARTGETTPADGGFATQSLTIFVEDVEAHFETAKSAGAKIVEALHETMYGEFQYGAEDLDGHHWLFSRHARSVSPADWGATITNPTPTSVPKVSPMLAVGDATAAVQFYKSAFDATVLWYIEGGGGAGTVAIAGLRIHGAPFFLAEESPGNGTRSPDSAGFTTVRIELFVDDPVAVHARAVAAGAFGRDAVREHTHETLGPQPIKRMLQGSVIDPSGHRWLIGKFLE